METAFEKAMKYSLKNEGGWAHVSGDHGGATKFGITIGTLRRWRKAPVSVQDVRDLTESEAEDIYKAWYWDTLDLDFVNNDAVAIALFDIGIVRGVGIPPKYAQKVCNVLGHPCTVDGHIGPKTVSAINACNPGEFIRHYAGYVEAGFRSIVEHNQSQAKFLKGWVNRAQRLLTLTA